MVLLRRPGSALHAFAGAGDYNRKTFADSLGASFGLFGGLNPIDEFAAECGSYLAEGLGGAFGELQRQGQVFGDGRLFGRLAVGQEDFYEIAFVDFQAVPDAAVDEEAMAAIAARDKRRGDRDAFDPALDWDEATTAQRFRDLGRDIDGAIDAEFIEAGMEGGVVIGAGHLFGVRRSHWK